MMKAVPQFENGGFSLHYEVHGAGAPVLLLHGGAVSFAVNFGLVGWIERLTTNGFMVIGLDARGHGNSQGSRNPADYGQEVLAGDAIALLDHLGIERAALVGYSIGTTIALHLLHTHPDRFTSSALVATGDGIVGYPPLTFPAILPVLAETLRREEFPADLPPHIAMYWTFATEACGDREAVRAGASADYPPCSVEEAASIEIPVLVVSGSADLVLGQGPRLAEALPKGTYLEFPDRDHFMLAIDEQVQTSVAEFLAAAAS